MKALIDTFADRFKKRSLPELLVRKFLTEYGYDHGPVIASRAIEVRPGDTVETLEARVRAAEPAFFVDTLQRIAGGELTLP